MSSKSAAEERVLEAKKFEELLEVRMKMVHTMLDSMAEAVEKLVAQGFTQKAAMIAVWNLYELGPVNEDGILDAPISTGGREKAPTRRK